MELFMQQLIFLRIFITIHRFQMPPDINLIIFDRLNNKINGKIEIAYY
jgi:hypothetical protein